MAQTEEQTARLDAFLEADDYQQLSLHGGVYAHLCAKAVRAGDQAYAAHWAELSHAADVRIDLLFERRDIRRATERSIEAVRAELTGQAHELRRPATVTERFES